MTWRDIAVIQFTLIAMKLLGLSVMGWLWTLLPLWGVVSVLFLLSFIAFVVALYANYKNREKS